MPIFRGLYTLPSFICCSASSRALNSGESWSTAHRALDHCLSTLWCIYFSCIWCTFPWSHFSSYNFTSPLSLVLDQRSSSNLYGKYMLSVAFWPSCYFSAFFQFLRSISALTLPSTNLFAFSAIVWHFLSL